MIKSSVLNLGISPSYGYPSRWAAIRSPRRRVAGEIAARSGSPAAQRVSNLMLRPSTQPSRRNSPCSAVRRLLNSASPATATMSKPTRRTRSLCCARAANGHALAQPRRVMNSRRLMMVSPFAPIEPSVRARKCDCHVPDARRFPNRPNCLQIVRIRGPCPVSIGSLPHCAQHGTVNRGAYKHSQQREKPVHAVGVPSRAKESPARGRASGRMNMSRKGQEKL